MCLPYQNPVHHKELKMMIKKDFIENNNLTLCKIIALNRSLILSYGILLTYGAISATVRKENLKSTFQGAQVKVLDAICYVDAAWKLVKSSMVNKSWREILSEKENEIPTDDDDSAHLQRKILEDLRKLDCSENVDEEAVDQ
ncbi:hypothetical protein AVEN_205121-1 [Araneus ventricosus]|uniref:DDE-1 domain-containing protein n=1 Tax=Araneus ventricosus TaxID=182803 RepID=A0A4Y2GHC0_ARAVE|nr:hypothetical protein AVEN_205121-1 [Araneus ventricosus]